MYYDTKYEIQNVSYANGNIVSGIGTEDGIEFAFPAVMFLDTRTKVHWNPIPDEVRVKWNEELEGEERIPMLHDSHTGDDDHMHLDELMYANDVKDDEVMLVDEVAPDNEREEVAEISVVDKKRRNKSFCTQPFDRFERITRFTQEFAAFIRYVESGR